MSDNDSQNLAASILTSTLIPPSSQTNSNEFKPINKVEGNIYDDDEPDEVANGGWGDDFAIDVEELENIKEEKGKIRKFLELMK